MRPPFPGMDPWLEHPALWPDVHNRLIASIADALVPLVDPRYFVGVESRMVLYPSTDDPRGARPDVVVARGDPEARLPAGGAAVGLAVEAETDLAILDVELPAREEDVEETYLELREVETQQLVTILEVLSPSNKSAGRGREQYLAKRDEVLDSATSLIEVDLLRAGQPMPLARPVRPSAYRVLVSRGRDRPRAQLFASGVRAPLPTIPVPLLPGDDEPRLDLNRVLHGLIDRARYFRRVDYEKPPVPPLSEANAAWAGEIVKRAE